MAHRWIALALACVIALAVAPAGASATTGASGHGIGAKAKKCKRHPKGRHARKRCRGKKKAQPASPLPVIRAVVSWSGNGAIDLHAWSAGEHSGWNETLGHYEFRI